MLDPNAAVSRTSYPTEIGDMSTVYRPTLRGLDQAGIEARRTLAANGVNVLAVAADEANKMGMDFWVFLRVGAWGFAQPFEVFGTPFFYKHPEFRAVDRQGRPWHTNSYAFPEVRKHVTDVYREVVRHSRLQGGRADGVVLGFSRGPIFLDYEPHVCDAFQKATGIDPRTLVEHDERWLNFRARYLTKFVAEMRKMLDEESVAQGRKIKLVAEAFPNERVNLKFGLDVRDWVDKGLVDVIQVRTEARGPFDRAFYKAVRAKGGGKLQVVIGCVPVRTVAEKDTYLNDFDGLATQGPTSPHSLDVAHPVRTSCLLKLERPMPPAKRKLAPGSVTGKATITDLQGLPISKPHYAAGL